MATSERNRLPGGPSAALIRRVRSTLNSYGIRPTCEAGTLWIDAWKWAYAVEQSYDRFGFDSRRRHWPTASEIAAQYVYLLLSTMGRDRMLRLPYRAPDQLPAAVAARIGKTPAQPANLAPAEIQTTLCLN